MVTECLVCDQTIDHWGFRLNIGAVDYVEAKNDCYELTFIREYFRDGETSKYLCVSCAERQDETRLRRHLAEAVPAKPAADVGYLGRYGMVFTRK